MKEKWGGPDLGKPERPRTDGKPAPAPDIGERTSRIGPGGKPWPAPDLGEPEQNNAPSRSLLTRAVRSLAIFGAVASTMALRSDEMNVRSELQMELSIRQAEKKRTYQETPAEREQREKTLAMLHSVADLLRSDRLKQEVVMFHDTPSNKETCTFIDQWYQPQKKNIYGLWKYAEAYETDWGPRLKGSLTAALDVSKVAAEKLNGFPVPERFWAPTTAEGLRAKLDKTLPKQPSGSSSCGWIFDWLYTHLRDRQQVENIQTLFRDMTIGFAELISTELDAHAPGDRTDDYRAAEQIADVANALFSTKAPAAKKPR